MSAAPLAAQYWAKPAKTPNTDVACATCPGTAKGKLTAGYPSVLGTYLGRYLDSSTTNDFQQHYRTARARNVVAVPSSNRIYFILGSGLMAYQMDRFFQRVAAGETLSPVMVVPVHWGSGDRLGSVETFLTYDQFFYAENLPTGWETPLTDGQERLYGFDVDDQNNIFLAYTLYGWGIVKDDLRTDGALMTSEYQYAPSTYIPDDVQANVIAVVKSPTTAHYYTLVSDASQPKLNLFDVTNRSAAVRQRSINGPSMVHFAKTTDMSKIGFVTADGQFNIYDVDSLVSGQRPLVSTYGPGNAPIRGVTSDGTNFFVAVDDNSGLAIMTYAPDASGNGYHLVTTYRTNRPTLNTMNLRYGDGYLTHASITDGGYELRLFKASVNSVSEIDLTIPASYPAYFFKNFYVSTGRTGYVAVGIYGQFQDSQTVKSGGHTYLVVTGYGLGDVYDIPSSSSLQVANLGSKGTPNPNRPATASAGPFYGDPVGFSSTVAGNAQTNVTWDFGNPEAANVAADPDTVNGVTGTTVTHRYSGITSIASLPLQRTVKVTSVSDPNVTGSVTANIATPTLSGGIKNLGSVSLTSNTTTTAPVVYGDNFVDTSDGSVESHFTTWSIDSKATNALPSETVPVGACAATHTLTMTGHYGPYTGTSPNETSLSDLPISISNVQYSVKPFAAAISVSSNSDVIIFTSASRITSDTSVLSAAQIAAMTYKWELLGANGSVLQAGPTGTNAASIPTFTVSKSVFTSRGIKAHLVLTSPTPVTGACAGLSMETSEAFTAALNGPDPVLNGDCTNGAPPCNFNVTSASSTNMVSDGWTYLWSATPATTTIAPSNTSSTYTPTFTAVGTYTLSVTVANAVGTATATKNVSVTTAGATCPTMTSSNVFMTYQATDSSCSWLSPSAPCSKGTSVGFAASGGFTYDFSCSKHTFAWTFGDGATATTQNASHTYSTAGTYQAKCVIANAAQSFTLSQTITVGGSPVPNPPPPPPVIPPTTNTCGTMVAAAPNQNVFIGYSTPSFSCSSTSPSTPCTTSDAIYFYAVAQAPGYDFSCGTHAFQWRYGDGGTATGQNPTPHTYTTAGTYTVQLTIASPTGQSVTLSQPVTVTGGTTTTPQPNGSCGNLVANQTVFLGYQTQSYSCSYTTPSQACPLSDPIYFYAFPGGTYDFACANHTVTWNFGDGTTGSGIHAAAKTYSAPGTYTVTLTVNNGSQSATLTQQVTVGNPTGTCGTITPNQSISFDAASSPSSCAVTFSVTTPNNQYNLSCAPHTFQWDFGDGSARSTGNTAIHQYASGGVYHVVLYVTVNGTTTQIPRSVTVASCSGVGPGSFPYDFTVAPQTVNVNGTIVIIPDYYIFNVFTNGKASTSGVTFKWDFGDGSTATGPATQVPHQYVNANNYTVTLSVDGVGSVSHNLLIHKRPASH